MHDSFSSSALRAFTAAETVRGIDGAGVARLSDLDVWPLATSENQHRLKACYPEC